MMRLLPKELDWTPYVWLIYLVYYALVPWLYPASAWERVVTVPVTLVALALYF